MIRRTAGPLGRLAGFELRIGRFFAAFNAGWYFAKHPMILKRSYLIYRERERAEFADENQ